MSQLEVENIVEIMEAVSLFKLSGVCSKGVMAPEKLWESVRDKHKTFGTLKQMFDRRRVWFDVKKELHKQVVMPTTSYGAQKEGET